MAYDVPHAPETEEVQGPLEATLSRFSELTDEMISTLTCLRPWWHYTTILGTAVKVTTRSFWAKWKNSL